MDKQGSYNSLSCSRYDSSIYVTSLVSKNGELSEEKFDIYYWLLSNGKITMVNRDFSLNTNTNYEYRIETKIDLDEKELIEKHINLAEDWIGVNLYCVEKFVNPTFDQIEMLGTIVKSCEIYSMRFRDQYIFEITLTSTDVTHDEKYIDLFGYLKESALIPYQLIMTQKLIDLDKENKNGRIYRKDFLKELQSKKINIGFPDIDISKLYPKNIPSYLLQPGPLSDLKLNFSSQLIKDKRDDKLDIIMNMYDILKRADTARLFNMVYGKENHDE